MMPRPICPMLRPTIAPIIPKMRFARPLLSLGAFIALFSFTGTAFAAMTEYPKVRLRSLDKTTARTMTFDAKVGTTIKFGSIYIKIQSCRKPDLQETPEAAAFLQVWEITPEDQSKWIFSGWMFASSPALSAMDHPIYDVWVIDCLDDGTKKPVPTDAAADPAKDKAATPPADDNKAVTPAPAPAATPAEKEVPAATPAATDDGDIKAETPADQVDTDVNADETTAPATDTEEVPTETSPDVGDTSAPTSSPARAIP